MDDNDSVSQHVLLAGRDLDPSGALARQLRDHGYAVRVVTSREGLLSEVAAKSLCAVVLQLELVAEPGPFMHELALQLRTDVRLIVATHRPKLETAVLAMRAGAEDYLACPMSPEVLLEALRRRGPTVPPVSGIQGLDEEAWVTLSEREREVVGRLYRGQSPRDIADALAISHYTVRNHLRSIYSKLGVHSQRELLTLRREGAQRA